MDHAVIVMEDDDDDAAASFTSAAAAAAFTNITADDDDTTDTNLSYPQYIGLVTSCTLGSLLGILGSCVILYCARTKWRHHLYHRTLAVMSILDILNSVTWMLHPLVFNVRGTPGLYGARYGTLQTCAAGGFLAIAFAMSMWFYSFYLGCYFVLIIRYRWTDRRIARVFEKPALCVALGISWTGATLGLATQSFNPRPNDLLCTAQGYPYQCELEGSTIPCERGGDAANAGWIIVSVALFCGFGGLVTTSMVYYSVWKVAEKHRRRHNHSSISGMEQRLASVAKQSMLYFLVYLNVILWPLLTNVVYGVSSGEWAVDPPRNAPLPYAFSVVSWFFFPITGLFNCMVYLRPRFVAWQGSSSNNPKQGVLWALRKAIGSETMPLPSQSQRRIMHNDNDDNDQEFKSLNEAVDVFATGEFRLGDDGEDDDDDNRSRVGKNLTKEKMEFDLNDADDLAPIEDGPTEAFSVSSQFSPSQTTAPGVPTETERTLNAILK